MKHGAVAPTKEDSVYDHSSLTDSWCGTQCYTVPCLAAATSEHGPRRRAHAYARDLGRCGAGPVPALAAANAPAPAGSAARAMDRGGPRSGTRCGVADKRPAALKSHAGAAIVATPAAPARYSPPRLSPTHPGRAGSHLRGRGVRATRRHPLGGRALGRERTCARGGRTVREWPQPPGV